MWDTHANTHTHTHTYTHTQKHTQKHTETHTNHTIIMNFITLITQTGYWFKQAKRLRTLGLDRDMNVQVEMMGKIVHCEQQSVAGGIWGRCDW
jgi:extradiol dioxygenase family protein